MSSHSLGIKGEEVAAAFLKQQGFTIIDRNWKTRWCEIDIVARKGNCLHFVEVKYRGSPRWGKAINYITPSKLRHMRFGALLWVQRYRWPDGYRLNALAIDRESVELVAIDD